MSKTTKRYLISSLITFLSMFLLTIGAQLSTISVETITVSSVFGILAVAVRAGVKALAEVYISGK